MILRKKNQKNQEQVPATDVLDLTVKKLTLKTGLKAGVESGPNCGAGATNNTRDD